MKSFELDGSDKSIEVKTTREGFETDFLISVNEVEFSKRHAASYCLVRLYDFDPVSGAGRFYVRRGSIRESIESELDPVVF